MRMPVVVGSVVCDRLGLDEETRKISLIGVVNAFYFPIFPSPLRSFTVYTALYDGVGEGKMELIIGRLETEVDTPLWRRWFTFPGRGRVANINMPVAYTFPAPGRYSLNLKFDNRLVSSRYVMVYQTRD